MRLSALMNQPVIYIMTHDSIGVGEDGPTHQPIEHLAALRSIPNFTVMRPCDAVETAIAWEMALKRTSSPTAIVLSRQNLNTLTKDEGAKKGGYVIRKSKKDTPDIILIATGSEVELAYNAYDRLAEKGVDASVVSMMSFEMFEEQTAEYKESVLPKNVRARLGIEAGSSFGWHKYIGLDGGMVAMDTFGASAPAGELFKHYGFTVDNVVDKAFCIYNALRS
jgi:transketolase